MLLEYVLVIWIGDNGAASSTIWANAGSKNALVSDGFKVQGAKKALTWMCDMKAQTECINMFIYAFPV